MAAPVTVLFQGALLEGGTPTTLPAYMAGNPDPNKIRLRFEVPTASSITSINAFNISVDVFDDGDNPANEFVTIDFVLAEIGLPNIPLACSCAGINLTTSLAPLNLTASADPLDFANILTAIQNDGIFFLRVNRDGGDFYLAGGTVTIDAESNDVPEPSALALAGLGLAVLGVRRMTIRRA